MGGGSVHNGVESYRLLPHDGLETVKSPTVQGSVHILNLKPHLWMTRVILATRRTNKNKDGHSRCK